MSFDLTDQQLGALFDQIPTLAGRPRSWEELSGGLTNRNLKVTTPDGTFVARCTDTNADVLGIDREVEHANTVAAWHAGVGAPVCDFRPDLGVLVIGHLEGRTLHKEDFAEPGLPTRVARAVRQLHDGPRFVGEFDMFDRQAGYLATVQREGYRIPDDYLELDLTPVREALAVLDEGTVPCNNDLLAENFIDDGERIWLIDYEYSGNNDACFELGNLACESHFDADQLEELVTAYYGRARPSRLARARLLGAVGQWGWTLWGAIQHAVSPLDFDFWAWATERWDGARATLTGPDLPALLDAVRTEDPR